MTSVPNANTLILVDGSSYLYRAFHALPPLTNSKGEPTGAIYGVINMLRKLLKDYQPEHIAVIFDAKGKTFRDDLYAHYKAHRPPMPDDLRAQIEPLHHIIQALGLPLVTIEGVEADDVIGTLTQQATGVGMSILISTSDKDIAQLVTDNITLVNTMTDTLLDRQGVMQKMGVPPERVVDYLTLVGDSSDNIPGVPNVGPKTAAKWLQEHGTLDQLIAAADSIKGKAGENFRNFLPQLPLSKALVTIKQDVPLTMGPLDLRIQQPDLTALKEWYTRLEFKNWLRELMDQTSSHLKKQNPYETILTESALLKWIKQLEQAELFSFDTETNDLDYMNARIVGVSFAITPHEAAYVPLAHDYLGAPPQLNRDKVLNLLKPLLENPQKKKAGA